GLSAREALGKWAAPHPPLRGTCCPQAGRRALVVSAPRQRGEGGRRPGEGTHHLCRASLGEGRVNVRRTARRAERSYQRNLERSWISSRVQRSPPAFPGLVAQRRSSSATSSSGDRSAASFVTQSRMI